MNDRGRDSEQRRALFEAWISGLRPDPRLDLATWAEKYIELSGAEAREPGPLRFFRMPYLIEPAGNLSIDSSVEKTSIIKGNQLGMTTLGLVFLAYTIDHSPGPAMFGTANLDLARKTSKLKLTPLIKSSDRLREKVVSRRSVEGSNTQLVKSYPGGSLTMVGANSAASLRSTSARYGVADEVDGWPLDVEGEGDPLPIFFGRFASFGRKKKILIASTPTVEGSSRIKSEYVKGDQREYRVPCPRCGHFQPIRFSFLRGLKGAGFKSSDPPKEVFLLCEKCEALIPEFEKIRMLPAGSWVPTSEPKEPRHRSYRLPSWYSPFGFFSWVDGVSLFLEAKRRNDQSKLKVWTNQINAETWKEREVVQDENVLFRRREDYLADVPAGALMLTAGVDVQDDRLEATLWGWGEGFEAWAIETRVFWAKEGETPNDYPGGLWDRLDEWLLGSWKHEHGQRLYCAAVGIDSGGHATQEVYQFAKDREIRSVFAMKGRGGIGVPEVLAPSRRRAADDGIPVELFTIGTDGMKDKLFSRLSMQSPGPGYLHFPTREDFDLGFFLSLTGEKKIVKFKKGWRFSEWVKTRNNEALDCYVYALAAAMILGPTWAALKKSLAPDDSDEGGSSAPPAPRAPQVRRGSWVTDWRRR